MVAQGDKRTFFTASTMSALPHKADIRVATLHVRYVPKGDSVAAALKHVRVSPPCRRIAAHRGQHCQATRALGLRPAVLVLVADGELFDGPLFGRGRVGGVNQTNKGRGRSAQAADLPSGPGVRADYPYAYAHPLSQI
jgi:hypothetical protein